MEHSLYIVMLNEFTVYLFSGQEVIIDGDGNHPQAVEWGTEAPVPPRVALQNQNTEIIYSPWSRDGQLDDENCTKIDTIW